MSLFLELARVRRGFPVSQGEFFPSKLPCISLIVYICSEASNDDSSCACGDQENSYRTVWKQKKNDIYGVLRYYGDLQWYAPDGINGDKMDTLLIIAVKTNNEELTSLILGLDGVDATKKNGKGLDAMTVAKALGREHLLLEMATSKSDTAMATSASDKVGPRAIHEVEAGAAAADGGDGGSAAMSLDALVPPPPGTFAGGEAGLEVVQLGYAVEMLKVWRSHAFSQNELFCYFYHQPPATKTTMYMYLI